MLKRVKKLLGDPGYRTKLVFFVLLGVLAGVLGFLLEEDPAFWADALKQFSIVFIAVGLLEFVWDFLGGDPVSLEVRAVQERLSSLSDLLDRKLGIERVWSTRRDWEKDERDGLDVWHARVCEADRVDILSNTFRSNWLKRQEAFLEPFLKALERNDNLCVRLVVYDPSSIAAMYREFDEEGNFDQDHEYPEGNETVPKQEERWVHEMTGEDIQTLETVNDIWTSEHARKRLKLGLTTKSIHMSQIIRADDKMIVAVYLSGQTGSHAPTLQLCGSGTDFFDKYEKQFELMWERARKVSPDQLQEQLKELKLKLPGRSQ